MLNGVTVVLGAGGPWGVAWMTGLLLGLEEAGIDVQHPDLVIGSSAGAMLGARLGAGYSLRMLYDKETSIEAQARQAVALRALLSSRPAVVSGSPSGAAPLLNAFSREWESESERVQAICQLARSARTVSWEQFEAFGIPSEYRSAAWPDVPLQIAVIDVDECRLGTFASNSGVSVSLAVLASCAIPGVFPPVPIKDHRYIDGGCWGSGDNAQLAAGAERVLVVSPLAAQQKRNALILDRDIRELQEKGARVHSVVADAASLAARGNGIPTPEAIKSSAEAGRAQGRQQAAEIRRNLV